MSSKAIWDRITARDGWDELVRWERNHEPEDVHLDFKNRSAEGRFSEEEQAQVAKAMSAFANVEGGVLVLGVSTKRDGDLDRVQSLKPFRDFEQAAGDLDKRLASLTDPPVPGARAAAIACPTAAGTGLVAVYAPASDGGPHQAARGEGKFRYFIRTGTGSAPAPHSILAGMFGRQPQPRLRFALCVTPGGLLSVFVINEGRGSAERMLIRLTVQDFDSALKLSPKDASFPPRWTRVLQQPRRGAVLYDHAAEFDGAIYALFDEPVLTYPNRVEKDGQIHLSGRIDALSTQPVSFDAVVELSGGDLVRVPAIEDAGR